ncbi:heparan-alpha-glucosaminide N-acetyltransferase domain-containing protein [Nocardioides sp. GXQ0305]|uniref:heparan-alpha-glucosaminide N-acetyltransferase domain-containing protein n=1 Tax=Nocardioides sp. GXQ0305 TaxID=3423912 RepID=UPI003D7DB6DC
MAVGRAPGRARLVGLDVARCLALLGMVSTHLLASRTPAGDEALHHVLAGGRASALFAVLAGTTLALASGGRTPARGRALGLAAAGLAARAVLVALLGLWLGGLDSGIAIILTYYGVLFLLGLPFLALGARALAVLAVVWLVVSPLVSHLLRPDLPARRFDNASFDQVGQPALLVSELLVTGYYPVLTWLTYLLAGMALGRSDLARRTVQGGLVAGGLVLAATATLVSEVLTEDRFSARTLDAARTDSYGTTPTGGDVGWLLVSAPHTGTPFDLAQTTGSALAVIGLCLLVVGALPSLGARVVAVLFGAGTMTLSLYSLHVWMRSVGVRLPDEPDAMLIHVVVLGTIGAIFVLAGLRGPLEWVVGLPGRLLRRVAARPPAGARST